MRTKKNNRTKGSRQWAANVRYAAGSVGHKPNTGARNRRNTVMGNRKAVMNPPREKRPHRSGSRNTPGSPVFGSAWTVSRPGLYARDSRVEPISSAPQKPPEIRETTAPDTPIHRSTLEPNTAF